MPFDLAECSVRDSRGSCQHRTTANPSSGLDGLTVSDAARNLLKSEKNLGWQNEPLPTV